MEKKNTTTKGGAICQQFFQLTNTEPTSSTSAPIVTFELRGNMTSSELGQKLLQDHGIVTKVTGQVFCFFNKQKNKKDEEEEGENRMMMMMMMMKKQASKQKEKLE